MVTNLCDADVVNLDNTYIIGLYLTKMRELPLLAEIQCSPILLLLELRAGGRYCCHVDFRMVNRYSHLLV